MSKKIIVFNDDCADFPENAKEFMAFWYEKLSLVPKEFFDSATIEVETYESYEESYLEATVSYFRPLTDEELAEQKQYEEDKEVENLMRKKIQFEKLKAELGE